ncbi:MAG: AIR synthase-related protein [Clostridia bacterium]|nr:AIR synthase-related protein [Clostridia bacterium]MDD4387083.1 AIR synthase-related protein [Clostridia bacterium]
MTEVRDPYEALGVSATKKGVHEATKDLSKGLYPGAFCKIIDMPNMFNSDFAQVIHSDGAGTKSNLAYLMKMEGYENYLKHFSSLAQDVTVMNIDDMAAVGIVNNIFISNHIGRNANRISDVDISAVINGYIRFFEILRELGIYITEAGGETADVGSYITTLGLDATTIGYIEKSKVIDCSNIKSGDIIVGLSSTGQSTYESNYNSGIRSNGLTLAINSMLNPYYRKYKEAWDNTLEDSKVFRGPYYLHDKLEGTDLTIGEALLSPTRTYLPILKEILNIPGINIHGIIHCSGGGMTKCINFGKEIIYVKYSLPKTPPLFETIQATEDIEDRYMLQTFNNGIGMDIIVPDCKSAMDIIEISKKFGVDATVIGYVEKSKKTNTNQVIIKKGNKLIEYSRDI